MFSESRSIKEAEIALRNRFALVYEDEYVTAHGRYWNNVELKTILKYLRPQANDVILDAGAGTGRLSIPLAGMVRSIISVDFSPKSIDILNKKAESLGIKNIHTCVCDLNELQLEKESIDKAVSVQVIQHIPTEEERFDALQRIYRSLKKSGILVMTVYNWKGKGRKEYYEKLSDSNGLYRYRFAATELSKLFSKVGFSNIKIKGVVNLPGKLASQSWMPLSFSYLDVWLSNFDFSRKLGAYLISIGRK